jgi:hypothetical protein
MATSSRACRRRDERAKIEQFFAVRLRVIERNLELRIGVIMPWWLTVASVR